MQTFMMGLDVPQMIPKRPAHGLLEQNRVEPQSADPLGLEKSSRIHFPTVGFDRRKVTLSPHLGSAFDGTTTIRACSLEPFNGNKSQFKYVGSSSRRIYL